MALNFPMLTLARRAYPNISDKACFGQRNSLGHQQRSSKRELAEIQECLFNCPVSGVSTPPGFQREIGVKAQGSSRSMSEAGWPAAMASSVALR